MNYLVKYQYIDGNVQYQKVHKAKTEKMAKALKSVLVTLGATNISIEVK